MVAVTSNLGRLLAGDYKVRAWRESGLLYPSIVTGIVRMDAVDEKLRQILAL